MTLPASPDSISFDQIRTEFGTPPKQNLGAYRVSETYGELTNLPLDTGIPKSGAIKFSHFRGKKLNVIVDFYSSNTPTTGETAKTIYTQKKVNIVGGFISVNNRPINTSGKKIIVHVNRTIGSTKGNINYCALKTGSWSTDTELILNVGTNGIITGAGGAGGAGGTANNSTLTDGLAGGNGTSALGVSFPLTIINNGKIRCGGGGGGGGGAAYAAHEFTGGG